MQRVKSGALLTQLLTQRIAFNSTRIREIMLVKDRPLVSSSPAMPARTHDLVAWAAPLRHTGSNSAAARAGEPAGRGGGDRGPARQLRRAGMGAGMGAPARAFPSDSVSRCLRLRPPNRHFIPSDS
jgi:hypothetical protein